MSKSISFSTLLVLLVLMPVLAFSAPVNDSHMEWWGAMTRKDKTIYLHVLEWKPEGIEFNGIVGKPSRVYFLADPKRQALPVTYEANGHLTKVEVPANAPDPRNTVIAVEYDAPVVTDPDAQGKYHWYTNRRTRHTDILLSEDSGRHALPNAVTGDK